MASAFQLLLRVIVMGVKISGFLAWWLWRTVYLMKTPGWGRRVRVALEWTLELFFKRDYVQLGVHPGARTGRRVRKLVRESAKRRGRTHAAFTTGFTAASISGEAGDSV